MSISVDDSGASRIPADHTATSPDLALAGEPPQGQPETLADALARFVSHADNSNAPSAYINALRHGIPGTVHTTTIDGTLVRYTLTEAASHCDPAREGNSWRALDRVVTTATRSGINPSLPPEIATATWEHAGRRINVCQPGTPSGTLRRARSSMRRRLAALSPAPALYALGQTVTGGVTAAGLVVAPLAPIPSGPAWPPISLPITATPDSLAEMPEWIVANTPDTGPPAARTTPTSRRSSPAPSASASTSPDTAPSPAATRAPAIVPPVSPLPETEATPAATSTTDAPTTAASPTPSTEPTVEVQPTPTITPTLRKILPPRPHTRPHPRKKHHGRHLLPEFLRPR